MSKKILVIDDEPQLIKLLEVNLRAEGYDVATATNGVAGLQQLKVQKPDLIILDAMMPAMDGVEFSRRLRQNQQFKDTPVILLSALVYQEGKPGDSDIADFYLAKPFKWQELLARVRSLLSEKP
jgi:two-component system alkaline phosphatase synthesis response regulator PhoP